MREGWMGQITLIGLKKFAPIALVIRGHRAAMSPESISPPTLRFDGFSDVQLHIIARAARAPE
ncbi:hypothetical protein [Bradyrhizobium cenepequi]|uniref:hypothetical protein n=1 Tax=Bradyrhizobium cenepequi TaxID=2821403 RepID=UPI001CE27A5E|nr:hypothetical protein [Bradyrhizobium cenepequi]MCA6109160.1 hypothetical protein [Bradyrhizobium cenepequi]